MLSPILHVASGTWTLGKIENHTAKPMSGVEIESHIALHADLERTLSRLGKTMLEYERLLLIAANNAHDSGEEDSFEDLILRTVNAK